jgi:anti-sigma-K factor RskA
MAEPHERYEELALGHVLGGLRSRDAAVFRAHLVECRECRLRVAELRDMAADLAATEREERRRAAVATQVADEEDQEEPPPTWRLVLGRWFSIGVVLGVVAVLSLLFWNYHLRRVTGTYAGVVAGQGEVLAVLAAGDRLKVETAEGVEAVAANEDGRVAVSLARLPELSSGSRLYVWLLAGDQVRSFQQVPPPESDALPLSRSIGEADTLLVTVERPGDRPPDRPGQRRLARVALVPVG